MTWRGGSPSGSGRTRSRRGDGALGGAIAPGAGVAGGGGAVAGTGGGRARADPRGGRGRDRHLVGAPGLGRPAGGQQRGAGGRGRGPPVLLRRLRLAAAVLLADPPGLRADAGPALATHRR